MRTTPLPLRLAVLGLLLAARPAPAQDAPAFRLPAPVTMAALAGRTVDGVAVAEVTDYVFGGYRGAFPSPPHADLNPRKAFVVVWEHFPYRLVFSHEASYCPWIELPSGAAASFQFFEGNAGWAELFNDPGRQERNSFVEVLEAGPARVWLRWHYTGVHMTTGEAAFRGVEDFWAFPNGLVLRRQRYHTLRPGDPHGYAREPMELIGMSPVGQRWYDVLAPAPGGEHRAFTGVDAFSDARVDVFWKRTDPDPNEGATRRTGAPWTAFDDARGVAALLPLRDGAPFVALGDASGFPADSTRLKEHGDRTGTGGWGWGTLSWDHWPVGWLNSQAHDVDSVSYRTYPSHFAPFGIDLWAMPDEATERRAFYSLLGVGGDAEEVRRLVRRWLEGGPATATDPAAVAALPALRTAPRRP